MEAGMRRIIMTMWISLDGFIAGPHDDMSWVRVDQALGTYEDNLVSAADTLLLGRVTYQSFAGAWPAVPESLSASDGEKAYARKLNQMRKIVYSRTLDRAEWNNSTLVHELNPDAIVELKREPGANIVMYGSASIVQRLMAHGLIDEYHLLIHPVVLGGGKRLFNEGVRTTALRLAGSTTFDSGVVLLTYWPADEAPVR